MAESPARSGLHVGVDRLLGISKYVDMGLARSTVDLPTLGH